MKKLINFIKNFVIAFLITVITMFFYGKLSSTLFMFFILLLYSGGLELYQTIYTKARFDPYDVVIRISACTLAWQLFMEFLR